MIELKRFTPKERKHDTLGLFMIDGKYQCCILEDPFHEKKIPGETRIPAGTYELKIRTYGTHHELFKIKFKAIHVGMIEITGVPDYTAILIHPGNFAKDTRGCLLPGNGYLCTPDTSARTTESTFAYIDMYAKVIPRILKGPTFITITDSL